jgi:hypothetical protein
LDDVEKLFEHAKLTGEFNSRFVFETLAEGDGDALNVTERRLDRRPDTLASRRVLCWHQDT